MSTTCRCGWDGQGDHPCHRNNYTCRKPAKIRYYEPTKLYALAGVQMKMSVVDTWACDECWEIAKVELAEHYAAELAAFKGRLQ